MLLLADVCDSVRDDGDSAAMLQDLGTDTTHRGETTKTKTKEKLTIENQLN